VIPLGGLPCLGRQREFDPVFEMLLPKGLPKSDVTVHSIIGYSPYQEFRKAQTGQTHLKLDVERGGDGSQRGAPLPALGSQTRFTVGCSQDSKAALPE